MRVVKIDNSGPMVTSSIEPAFVSPYVMDNVNPSVVTVTYTSGPPITSVTFYKEMADSTTLIGTVTSAPWSITVTAYEILTGGSVTIKAIVYSSPGAASVRIAFQREVFFFTACIGTFSLWSPLVVPLLWPWCRSPKCANQNFWHRKGFVHDLGHQNHLHHPIHHPNGVCVAIQVCECVRTPHHLGAALFRCSSQGPRACVTNLPGCSTGSTPPLPRRRPHSPSQPL